MKWNKLEHTDTLAQIKEDSSQHPIMLFKHSTRCSISSMTLSRLERSWNSQELPEVQTYFLDLVRYRDVSNQIAHIFNVTHQSPQVLIIKDGKCVYNASHMGITYSELQKVLKEEESNV